MPGKQALENRQDNSAETITKIELQLLLTGLLKYSLSIQNPDRKCMVRVR